MTTLILCLQAASLFAQSPTREIKVRAAVSSQFKKDVEWEKDIKERILFANQAFEKSFGIHFSLKDFVSWNPQDETREMGLLLEELRSAVEIEPNEILVGFHHMSKPFNKDVLEDIETVGSAQFFQGIAILRDPFQSFDALHRNIVFAHEMGHLFGAVHVSGEGFMMRPSVPEIPMMEFDSDNSEIIQATHDVDFKKGLDSLSPEAMDTLIRVYEKLIRTNPMSDFYFQLGQFYRKRGQEARGVAIWEEAIRYHYSNPHIHRELGFYYYRSGRYDLAIQELGSATAHFILPSQKKEKAHTLNFLGVAYYEKGNKEQAVFTWLKGLVEDADNFELQANLAAAYLETGSLDRGIAELEKLAAKYPNDPTTLSNLGVAYMKKGDSLKAAEYFRLGLEKRALDPSSRDKESLMQEIPESDLHLNLGVALLNLKQYPEAVAELEKAKTQNPTHFEIRRALAQAYTELHQYDLAVKEIQEALRYKKDDPYLFSYLAQAYAETGKSAEAIQAAREALKSMQDNAAKAMLRMNLAMLYAKGGQLQDAATEMRISLNEKWSNPAAHTNLGYIYLQMGKKEEARHSFETAIRIDSGYEDAKKALQGLQQ